MQLDRQGAAYQLHALAQGLEAVGEDRIHHAQTGKRI
jgi:hypothetical protein